MSAIDGITRLVARPRRPLPSPSKLVAVVVPVSARPALSADEEVSLRHIVRYLGAYDKYLVGPASRRLRLDGFAVARVPDKLFGSLIAINNLWYYPPFFEAFADYTFILYCHLDSLVLSDQLTEWCHADFDYIGPPWIRCDDSPWVDRPRVGNGGFVLVKVASCLKVLYARYEREPWTYWRDVLLRNYRWFLPAIRTMQRLRGVAPGMSVLERSLARWDMVENPGAYGLNSDLFWSDLAVRYAADFKVASLEDGLRFGFEASPRTCFAMNGGRLPFGCHAWPRYDRAFWEPFLLA